MFSESQILGLGIPPEEASGISTDVEQTMLELVVDGFKEWEQSGFKRFGNREDDYTARLAKCMQDVNDNSSFRVQPEYPDFTDEMQEGDEDSRRAPHIDIVIFPYTEQDVFLSIECKRLAKNDLTRLYVVEGVDRFVTGKYGRKSAVGAMVGYIIEGAPEELVNRINVHIERHQGMGHEHRMSLASPIHWLQSVYNSDHIRSEPHPLISLTHLLFDLTHLN